MQYINAGDHSNVVASGGDSEKVTQSNSRVDSAAYNEKLNELHAALLADARTAPDRDADNIRDMAGELREIVDSEQGASDSRLKPLLRRIKTASEYLGGMMASTSQVLVNLKDLGTG